MSITQLEVMLVAVLVAAACALSGSFLVLRRMALLSDAISHSILFGIVVMFLVTHSLKSPLLIIGAALTGVLTAWLVELLLRTRLVREDTSIGLVFPLLFALGVILISRYAGQVHLDVDAVLLGEIAFAPLDRLALFGLDLPKAAWVLMGVLLLNIAFLGALYKELKLSTFDAGLAVALGFAPALLHYLLVGLVSVTAVAAFDAVGSVLVVALMIAPPATAYLLTDRLPVLLAFAVAIGAGSAAAGYLAAIYIYDTNIAGMMAVVAGLMFALALTFGPRRGLMAKWLRRRRQRWEFPANLLAVHLLQHEHAPDAPFECSRAHCREHFSWESAFTERVISYATGADWVREQSGRLALTPAGREVAVAALRRS